MDNNEHLSQRLALAELQAERSKAIMDSLTGFCHALGQPATVILSGTELLRMSQVDDELRKQVLDMLYDAALQIRSLLAEMKEKREYVAEAYLANNPQAGDMIAIPEWAEKAPPKSSWDK